MNPMLTSYVIGGTYNWLGIFAEDMFHRVQSGHNALIARYFALFHWHIEIHAENMESNILNASFHLIIANFDC